MKAVVIELWDSGKGKRWFVVIESKNHRFGLLSGKGIPFFGQNFYNGKYKWNGNGGREAAQAVADEINEEIRN